MKHGRMAILQGIVEDRAQPVCEFRRLLSRYEVEQILGREVEETEDDVLWETDLRVLGSVEDIEGPINATTKVPLSPPPSKE